MILCFWWAIFFLLALLWELLKAIWWVFPLGMLVLFVLAHADAITDGIKRYWKQASIIFGVLALIGIITWFPSQCSHGKTESVLVADSTATDTIAIEPIDSAQIASNLRKDSIFEGNIFARLRFGMNKSEYQRLIRRYKNKYGNKLYVPTGNDSYETYSIIWIEPTFRRDKLYMVKIRLPYRAYYELDTILEGKYGKTKYNRWTWSNVEIGLSLSPNRPYDPSGDKGYGSSASGLYYEYSGSTSLTGEPGKTYLEYKDLTVYNLVLKETQERDSIRRAKEDEARRIQIQKEREKANEYKENI